MKTYIVYAAILLCLSVQKTFSQEEIQLTTKDSVVQSSWVVGLGINIVDDSATPFGSDFINIKESWNMVPYPSRVSIGRFFKNGFGLEAIGTYNKYKVGKLVDGEINTTPRDYYAVDGKISYDLNKLIGETAWFDPYIHAGAGYSSIGSLGRVTANTGFGFNTWFDDKWGLNFNTMGKWGIKEGSTKQLQHSAGVVYRFGVEKALSQKGEEKLALIQGLEEERQRVSDSIATAKNAEEEAKALADRLAKEKETAKLAATEKAEMEAEKRRKVEIENTIKDFGNVFFALNSSYLSNSSKNVLDQLATFMQDNTSLRIKVGSHTDSRGTDKYNMWLSEKRVKRTVDYLISKGIARERLTSEALGEEQLTNHCDDGIPCSEKEHRENRRSEFKVPNY